MADFDFENPTFDPDGPGIDDDYSLDLPDAIMDPFPPRIQQDGCLVGCFGLNGPLRQYFSLYRAVSQREGERKEK